MAASTTLIVAAIVRRGDELLLVEQQGPWDPEPSWMLPGGRVEPGETLLKALARELKEETGLPCVAWYDCIPLERFLSGEAAAGTVYAAADR